MILCDFDAFCMAPVTRTTTKTGSFPSWYEMYTNFSPFSFSSRPLPVEIEGSFIPIITMYSFIPSFPSNGPTSATASDSCKSTNGKIGLVKLVSLVDLHHFTIKWNYLLACFFIIIRCKSSFLALFAFFMFFQFQKIFWVVFSFKPFVNNPNNPPRPNLLRMATLPNHHPQTLPPTPNKSGQIKIYHQPRFPWNKGISLPQLHFGVRSCEVARTNPNTSSRSPAPARRIRFLESQRLHHGTKQPGNSRRNPHLPEGCLLNQV